MNLILTEAITVSCLLALISGFLIAQCGKKKASTIPTPANPAADANKSGVLAVKSGQVAVPAAQASAQHRPADTSAQPIVKSKREAGSKMAEAKGAEAKGADQEGENNYEDVTVGEGNAAANN